MTILYLAGPINGCSDEECKDWREHVKKIWNGKTLDPMRRDYRGIEDQSINEIVEFDKIDIINSDVLLVSYEKPSVGTSMEILYAWERGKIVVIVSKTGINISPWLKYHSHSIHNSYEKALNWIKEVRD